MRQKYRKCPRLSQVGKMPKLSVHNAHKISNTALEGHMKPSVLHFINIQLHLHLADAFIQSDLQCIQTIHFYQYVCSLGIEPTTFCAANAMLYHWATGTYYIYIYSKT